MIVNHFVTSKGFTNMTAAINELASVPGSLKVIIDGVQTLWEPGPGPHLAVGRFLAAKDGQGISVTVLSKSSSATNMASVKNMAQQAMEIALPKL